MNLFSRWFSRPKLKVGDPAPEFTAKLHDNSDFDLKSRKGKWTVLYFYPKDDTPGCTKEACAIRDQYSDFISLPQTDVFGISQDKVQSHAEFRTKFKLPFGLLADEDGAISKAYETHLLKGVSRRWTYILDPSLTIAWIQRDVSPTSHANEILQVLKTLQK